MKHSALARLFPWLLVAVCPLLLGRCGGAAERGTEKAAPGSSHEGNEVTASSGSGSQSVETSAQTSDDVADAGEGGPPGACTDLRKAMARRVSAGFANVDKTCQRDEDCFYASTNTGCFSSCESVLTSRSGVRADGAGVEQDIAALCNEFDDLHCETPIMVCNGGQPVVACNGTCTRVDALGCDDLPAVGATRVATLVNDASRACSRDDDCTLVQAGIRCVPSCGNFESVASSALAGLQSSIVQTEASYCGFAESRGCPASPQLPCVPPLQTPQATCNAGQCEIKYVPLF